MCVHMEGNHVEFGTYTFMNEEFWCIARADRSIVYSRSVVLGTGDRPVIRNPENKVLLTHLGSFTLTSTITTETKIKLIDIPTLFFPLLCRMFRHPSYV
jgi:hypothetical protein